MAFNQAAYAEAMDDFLVKMEKIPTVEDSANQDALSSICNVLRVARVEAVFYQNPRMEAIQGGNLIVVYSKGEGDLSRVYEVREQTGTGEVVVYRLYQGMNEADWEEEELAKLAVVQKMLFTFHERALAVKLAEEWRFKDQQLGIYNLSFFMKRAEELIAKKQIGAYGAAFINLKRYTVVNRQIGREQGTEVMRSFVTGLQDKFSEGEYICRVGGDNFVILFLKAHLDLVMEYLEGTDIIYDKKTGECICVSANAGYYMIEDNCKTAMTIMDAVSMALHVAKNIAKTSYVFFDEDMMKRRTNAKLLEDMFPSAMERGEFQVFYQPKIQLRDYKLAGAEALCRWFRNGEIVPPGEFIPILEQGKAICKLDFYVLERVCKDLRRWLDAGKKVVRISVNFSRRHMGDVFLLEHILEIIDRYQVPHEYIEIELTETTMEVDFKELKKLVKGLNQHGISTSVDDFGMGYSSLKLIRELPWSVLKVDKSFLPDEQEQQPQKYVILKHLIALTQDMGLECIVEGVETVNHVKLLKENNCFLAQGFYFDKPLPVEAFEKRLDALG